MSWGVAVVCGGMWWQWVAAVVVVNIRRLLYVVVDIKRLLEGFLFLRIFPLGKGEVIIYPQI